jgi:mono/diheme cytochrome c family protein
MGSMETFMTKAILAGTILFLFLLSSASAQVLPEDPTKGARLFVSKGCVKCHALRGEGGKIGPDLGKIDLGGTELELASKLLNHLPSMMQGMERTKILKSPLTGKELSEIFAYLYFLRFFDEPGDPSRGRYVFTEKGCNSCHPLSGRGREGAPGLDQFPQNISPIFLSQAIWNHGPIMIAGMTKLGIKWPAFKGTDLMDLLAYVKTNAKGPKETAYVVPGNPKDGKKIFTEKGCIRCHAIRGAGGKEAEDLDKMAKTFYTSLTQIASIMWDKGPVVFERMAQTRIGIPKFAPKEMADLIAYLYFLHFSGEPGNPAAGRMDFQSLGCSNCHSVNGIKGKFMQIDLSKYQKPANPMDIVAAIWDHSSEIEKAMKEKGISWPKFKKGELVDLIEFFTSSRKK